MIAQLAAHFAAHGLETGLTAASVAAEVAARTDVPVEWVSLQERHIARAFQGVAGHAAAGRAGVGPDRGLRLAVRRVELDDPVARASCAPGC